MGDTKEVEKDNKPVLVYVYGAGLSYPSYEDVAALQKTSQPFVLIPPPDEKGAPSIPLESADYNTSYIQQELENSFGKGGEYAGREYTAIVYTHGLPKPGGYGHIHNINQHNAVDSKALYETLLSANGQCIGVSDYACFSGTGIVGFNEAMRATVDKQRRPVEFTAFAPFDRGGEQLDAYFTFNALRTHIQAGKEVTPEVIRSIYLTEMDSSARVISRTFDPAHLDPEWHVAYDDLEKKLGQFYENFHDYPTRFPSRAALDRLFELGVLNDKKHAQIRSALQANNYEEFCTELAGEDLVGEAFAVADEYYGKVNNKALSRGALITHNLVVMQEDVHWQAFLSAPENHQQNLEYIRQQPAEWLAHSDAWSSHVGEVERKEMLTEAARAAAEKAPAVCFQYASAPTPENSTWWRFSMPENTVGWDKVVTAEARREILATAADIASQKDPVACMDNISKWEGAVSEEKRHAILTRAIHLSPGHFLTQLTEDANPFYVRFPPEEYNKCYRQASVRAAEVDPRQCLRLEDKWGPLFSENERHELIRTAAHNIAETDANSCFKHKDVWERHTTPKEQKEILATAARTALETDPAACIGYLRDWSDAVSPAERDRIIRTSIERVPGFFLDYYESSRQFPLAPLSDTEKECMIQAAKKSAMLDPEACFTNQKNWQQYVSQDEVPQIFTQAAESLAKGNTEHFLKTRGQWESIVAPEDKKRILSIAAETAAQKDPRRYLEHIDTFCEGMDDGERQASTYQAMRHASYHASGSFLQHFDRLKDIIPPHEQTTLLTVAGKTASVFDPGRCMEFADTLQAIPESERKKILQNAALRASRKLPEDCIKYEEKWKDAVSAKEHEEIMGVARDQLEKNQQKPAAPQAANIPEAYNAALAQYYDQNHTPGSPPYQGHGALPRIIYEVSRATLA